MHKAKEITLLRAFVIFFLGLVSGIQLALYWYDFYDDGIADYKSLLIGIGMGILSIGFILFSFRSTTRESRQ